MGPGSRPGRQRRLSRLLSPHCQSCSRFKQQMRVHIPAAGYARVLREARPSNKKRAQGMPGEGFTHGPPATKKAGGSHHRISRIIRHSLRDGFSAYGALSLGTGLSCSHRPRDHRSASLASASGGQDHTLLRPHRSRSSGETHTSIATRLTCRDDRETPSASRRDDRSNSHDSEKRK